MSCDLLLPGDHHHDCPRCGKLFLCDFGWGHAVSYIPPCAKCREVALKEEK